MKQAGYTKRSQGRSSERHRQHSKQTHRDSADPKIRGNAQQCVEKYLILARDAASAGDPVSAENYYQFADHYYRISLANRPPKICRSEKGPDKLSPPPQMNPEQPEAHSLEAE